MQALALDWYQVKLFVERSTGVSMDALHLVLGVMLFFTAAWVLRTTVDRWRPLLVVLAVELINEVMDFRAEIWPDFGMQAGEGARDVMLTMAVPTLIFLVARNCPQVLVTDRKPVPVATATARESDRGATE